MGELLFYDIEIFRYNALVIFKDIDKKIVAQFHNDFGEVYDLVDGKTLVGYNNHWYDDHILTAMIKGWSNHQLKDLNDRIIGGEKMYSPHKVIHSLDCFQQIDVAMPSLKKIEGNFGKSVIESAVDFNIDRPLTSEELEETIKYCSYDVDTTIDIYKLRVKSYFEPKEQLIEMLPVDKREKARKWNTTTISANILTDTPLRKWSDVRLEKDYDPKNAERYAMYDLAPEEAVNLWMTKDKGKVTHRAHGCNYEFGFGGLHGVPASGRRRFENVIMLDVASLYPNIIMKLGALGDSTEIYRGIVEKRLAVKHTDQQLQLALKLVINSCYGLLKNKYSTLNNPKASKSVCIFGQIALYDLCERLAPSCQLVNINTDGVGFTTTSEDYKTVWEQWEEDYGFVLEEDRFDLFIQKDVNNYIAVDGDKIKCKGGDVGRYYNDAYFRNNNLRIVDIAVVDKLVHGKDVLTTIQENLDNPRLFQMILQAGGTYKGTFDADGNQYNKVNRVFPLKKGGVTLYKKRMDDGLVHFPDAPEHMLIWNQDCDDLVDFGKKVDINFYYELINKTLERWEE